MSERQIPYYFSSVRGNISSITCDYGNPCPPDWALVRDDAFRRTLRRCIFVLCVLLNRFSLLSLEAANRIDVVLLSGVYSFGNIDPSTPMGKLIDSISFYGAKDCWPAPENVYDCAATTPVVNALSTISYLHIKCYISGKRIEFGASCDVAERFGQCKLDQHL
jgi:hypothetical protein